MATRTLKKPKKLAPKERYMRLVVASLSKFDVETLAELAQAYGHNARAGAVRMALRKFSDVERGEAWAEQLVIQVRREACVETDEHKDFAKTACKVPVNLEHDDSGLIEEIKARWELSSFAQTVRLALRYTGSLEAVK